MKEFRFSYSILIPQTAWVKANTQAEAEAELRNRQVNRNRELLELTLTKETELKWFATKTEVEQGSYVNDEYEMHHGEPEQVGPFDTIEEALQAVKDSFGYMTPIKSNHLGDYEHMVPAKPGYWTEYAVVTRPC